MLSTEQGLLALCLAGTAACGFWYGLRSLAKCRAVQNTPLARIRSAAQGYTELTGRGSAPPHTVIRGPLTGKPCIWWHYEIHRGAGHGDGAAVDQQTSETPFLLDDATGQCLVDPCGAEVVHHVREEWRGSTPWPDYRLPPTGGVLGALYDSLMSRGRYRYIECRLETGLPLYALGQFRTSGGVSLDDPEDGIAQQLHEWKEDQAALLDRFDRNRDGRLDGEDWEAVRAAARAAVLQKRKAREQAPAIPTLVAPDDDRAYLLSGADPAALLRRFRWRAAGGIALFIGSLAALTAFARTMA